MDHTVEDGVLLEINRMELRSGRNLVKHAADSTEHDGTTTTSKENVTTPRRKSVNIKKSIGKEKENEEPGISTASKENVTTPRRKSVNIKKSIGKEKENEEPDAALSRKSTQRKMNKRKSKLEEENEVAETSPLVDNAQTPTLGLSQTKKRRKSMLILQEHPAETSPLVDNAQTPTLGLSQTKKRRKSMLILQEHPGTSTTSKENTQTPTRKSMNTRSIGKEKEKEEPVDESQSSKLSQRKINRRKSTMAEDNEVAVTYIPAEESPGRKSSQAKTNRRKSMWDEETELGTPTTSKENVQTPRRKSLNAKTSLGKEKENEEPVVICDIVEESPAIKSSQRKTNKRKSKLEEEIEVAKTSPLVENAQSPQGRPSQTKRTRKSMQILEEQSIDESQSSKSSQRKTNRRKSMFEEENEVAITCVSVEESPGRKSSQTKTNRRKSMWDGETEVVTACTLEDTSGTKSSETKINKRKSKQDKENEELGFSNIVQPSQESEISSSLVIEDVEKNEFSAPASDKNVEDVAEVLNSTFEVLEEDAILQTPAHKRSVRFADKVETRRQSSCMDSSPKFSTPVSVNSKQRSSQHKGTPHPSAKKRPASILKNSSSKKLPSSSKDKSLRGTGSVRKMPDFNSIHKAQFEKMESIVDFSHRRQKCVRKLETQEADDSDEQMQLKPSAIVKPMEQKKENAISRIPVAPRNTSRSGTPRALSSSHIPLAGFHVLTEKNFDARRSTPHLLNSRPTLKNVDARRSTPQAIKSRPSLTKIVNNSRPKPVTNPKPQRITYEQAKATIQNKNPFTAATRETARLENRNLLKGVRLNRRFELQMQHRKINM